MIFRQSILCILDIIQDMNPVYILVLSAESQSDITRCLYNSKENISRLPIAADTSTIQFIHIGDLPKD
jgi:hypothetical protein